MPASAPINRRSFITNTVAFAGMSFAYHTWAQTSSSDAVDRVVLLSDIHISADPERVLRGAKMAKNLSEVVTHIRSTLKEQPPKTLCITGDIALNDGLEGDYEQARNLLQPLRDEGLPMHLLMGNHDHREHCGRILGRYQPQGVDLDPHIASKISLGHVNLYLLDSLIRTNHTPGELGAVQIAWLEKELEADASKPSVLLLHHNLRFGDPKNALTDTQTLFGVIKKHPHVKAAFYGHSHRWEVLEKEGKHLINLPPTAYVFDQAMPNGWVDARFHADRSELTLHTLDKNHPLSQSHHILKWS